MEADTCKKELVIEIPVEAVQRESENVTTQYARVARIPGFRPGHAPASLVRNRFKKDIRDEVVQSLLPKFFQNAVKDQKLTVVGQPHIADLKFEENQPLTCKVMFEVYPAIELKEYKGLEAEQESATIAESDVEEAIGKVREREATFEAVPDRPAAKDDFLMVSYKGLNTKDAENHPVEAKEAMVHLGGEGTVEGFTENLVGSKPGEIREFDVAYPDNYPRKALAGTQYHYRVEVQSIKKKVLPPIDDDLAKSVSDFSTLEELKSRMREDLTKARARRVEEGAKAKLLEQIIKAHEFPIPEILVEERLDGIMERTFSLLLKQGIDPRTTEIDWRKLREDSRSEAEKQVRSSLVLDKIAEAEKIEVSEEEVDNILREMAQESGEAPAALKTRLTREGSLGRIESRCRSQKAIDFIYRNAKITTQSK